LLLTLASRCTRITPIIIQFDLNNWKMKEPVVLIVEDDNIARFVFKKLVTKLKISCYEAANGEDALHILDEHKEISHVFLDLNMPVLDGYGFLHYLNSGKKHDDLNVYVTTVCDSRDFQDTVSKRNIDVSNVRGYHKKPFSMAQLTQTIFPEASC
jgi:CheY-like chemotaxis protein